MPGAYPRDLACPAALPVAANPRIGHSTQLDNHLCKRHDAPSRTPVARTPKKKPMPQRHRFLEPIHNVKEERLRSKSAAEGREYLVFNPGGLLASRKDWWSQSGSNRRPQACKASALPTELWPPPSRAHGARYGGQASSALARGGLPAEAAKQRRLVGRVGVEPTTSRLSGVRSNHLSYRPPVAWPAKRPQAACEPAQACTASCEADLQDEGT